MINAIELNERVSWDMDNLGRMKFGKWEKLERKKIDSTLQVCTYRESNSETKSECLTPFAKQAVGLQRQLKFDSIYFKYEVPLKESKSLFSVCLSLSLSLSLSGSVSLSLIHVWPSLSNENFLKEYNRQIFFPSGHFVMCVRFVPVVVLQPPAAISFVVVFFCDYVPLRSVSLFRNPLRLN